MKWDGGSSVRTAYSEVKVVQQLRGLRVGLIHWNIYLVFMKFSTIENWVCIPVILSAQDLEAGGLAIQGHCWLCSKFEDNLGHVKPLSQTSKQKET